MANIDGEEELCPPALQQKGYKINAKDLIAKGGYSSVYMATKTDKNTNSVKTMALKRIVIDSVPPKYRDNCLKREMKVLKRLSHPHIIRIFDILKTKKIVYIFMTYCPKGTIYKKLLSQKSPFDEITAKIWFAQLLGALYFCHSKGIAHRDLKLDNFLLNCDNDALLSDFGFAVVANTKSSDIMRNTSCGHPAYMAPEVVKETKIWPYDAKAADMWSMGVCLFEMVNFDKPFDPELANTNSFKHVLKQRQQDYRLHGPVEKKLSKDIKELIKRMLDPIPGTRIKANEALLHSGLIIFPKENEEKIKEMN